MTTAGGYEIVPVVKTPSVRPGETVRIDVYCSGSGIPKENTLRVGCDADLVSRVAPGEGQVPNFWVATHGRGGNDEAEQYELAATDGGADWTTERTAVADADTVVTEVTLNPVRFDRAPQPDNDTYTPSYRVSKRPHTFVPPAQVEIQTDEHCPIGEYEIPFTFAYPDTDGVHEVTTTATVQVGSFGQRLRSKAAAGVSSVAAAMSLF